VKKTKSAMEAMAQSAKACGAGKTWQTFSKDIYIKGWLAPDFTIQRGQAVLTSDINIFRLLRMREKLKNLWIWKP